jgi:hypothetical protein
MLVSLFVVLPMKRRLDLDPRFFVRKTKQYEIPCRKRRGIQSNRMSL